MQVLVIRNNSNSKAVDASLLLATYLSTQGIRYLLVDSLRIDDRQCRREVELAGSEGIDLAVVLGGDGTILRTARLLAGLSVPVLGINFGRLGFLANACQDGVVSMVARALEGDMTCERRTNMRVDVVCEGEDDPFDTDQGGFDWNEPFHRGRGGEGSDCAADAGSTFGVDRSGVFGARTFFALNEVALTRGAMGRIISLSLSVSDHRIAEMRGDGMVVATATGSTAYALSAGGPLVAPSYTGLIVVPLAPHTLRSRALLTGDNDVVELSLTGDPADREATLFLDGTLLSFDKPVVRVYVRRGDEPTLLLRSEGEDFYDYAAKTFF